MCTCTGSKSRSTRIGQWAALGQAGGHAKARGQAATASRCRQKQQHVGSGRGQAAVVSTRGSPLHHPSLVLPSCHCHLPAAHCLLLAAGSLRLRLVAHTCNLCLWLALVAHGPRSWHCQHMHALLAASARAPHCPTALLPAPGPCSPTTACACSLWLAVCACSPWLVACGLCWWLALAASSLHRQLAACSLQSAICVHAPVAAHYLLLLCLPCTLLTDQACACRLWHALVACGLCSQPPWCALLACSCGPQLTLTACSLPAFHHCPMPLLHLCSLLLPLGMLLLTDMPVALCHLPSCATTIAAVPSASRATCALAALHCWPQVCSPPHPSMA
jgi:hypothetical protein